MFKPSFEIPHHCLLTFAKGHFGKGDQLANLREEKGRLDYSFNCCRTSPDAGTVG